MFKTLRQRFDEWVAQLPPESALGPFTSVQAWLATSVVVLIAVAFAAWIPFSAQLLSLHPWPALVAYAAAMLTDFVWIRLLRQGQRRVAAVLIVVQSFIFQLFCVLLMVHSSTEGAVFFASSLLAGSLIQGSVYRSDSRHPFISGATILASAVGVAIAPSSEHIAVLVVIGLVAAVLAAFLGRFAMDTEVARQQAEQLRSTIQAQQIWEQSLRADRLAGSLEQVAQWNHDMRNAMTAAVCNAQVLAMADEHVGEGGEDLRVAIDDIQQSLQVLATGFDELRRISKQSPAETKRQSVDAAALARSVVAGLRARFPGVAVAMDLPSAPVFVLVRGGAVSVHRVLENLLVNACEGDGKRAARHVALAMTFGRGGVRIEVRDDGPGFPEYLLDGAAPLFVTSKSHGSGLGLHSVEQLVAASEGRVHRSNAPAGGAVVVVELPADSGAATG